MTPEEFFIKTASDNDMRTYLLDHVVIAQPYERSIEAMARTMIARMFHTFVESFPQSLLLKSDLLKKYELMVSVLIEEAHNMSFEKISPEEHQTVRIPANFAICRAIMILETIIERAKKEIL